MKALNLKDGDITQRAQIVQLLQMIIAQEWSFSLIRKVKKRVSSQSLDLLSLNVEEAIFRVSSETMDPQIGPGDSIMFRAQSGGISILFQSRMAESSGAESSTADASWFEFELPYKVACTQLRKSARVNLEGVFEVPVSLYLNNGSEIAGTVMDISTSGAKFRINTNLGRELKSLESVRLCEISLPDDLVLCTGIQIIGFEIDEENNQSHLRCQFVQMKSSDEEQLDSFVEDTLKQSAPS